MAFVCSFTKLGVRCTWSWASTISIKPQIKQRSQGIVRFASQSGLHHSLRSQLRLIRAIEWCKTWEIGQKCTGLYVTDLWFRRFDSRWPKKRKIVTYAYAMLRYIAFIYLSCALTPNGPFEINGFKLCTYWFLNFPCSRFLDSHLITR